MQNNIVTLANQSRVLHAVWIRVERTFRLG
jgi:hypothetical protein